MLTEGFDRGRVQRNEMIERGAQVAMSVNHLDGIEHLGRWAWFSNDEYGLRGQAVFSDTPAGHLALGALDSGEAGGFSTYVRPVRMIEEPQRVHGRRAFTVTSALLVEAGPVTEQHHRGAIALDIAGRPPRWQVVQDARNRDRLMREAGIAR